MRNLILMIMCAAMTVATAMGGCFVLTYLSAPWNWLLQPLAVGCAVGFICALTYFAQKYIDSQNAVSMG